mmetsp:Transcript_19776/g.27460  ORF Transcript_19776/g.27460 Transcript_19776/m.27460 type:complete len:92 (-) Transcript_19776:18-293(-)
MFDIMPCLFRSTRGYLRSRANLGEDRVVVAAQEHTGSSKRRNNPAIEVTLDAISIEEDGGIDLNGDEVVYEDDNRLPFLRTKLFSFFLLLR